MNLSRRCFLQNSSLALAAIPFKVWAGSAQGATSRVRYGIHTPEGQKALVKYSKAFSLIKDLVNTDQTDPRGLAFQYRIHMFPDNWDDFSTNVERQAGRLVDIDAFFDPTLS
jgi:hypothetical protein